MRLKRVVWRAHHPRWSFAPVSGEGAARHGGRFNRIGVPALYTSLRMETAWIEAQQGFTYKAQPLTMCAYEVDCEDILDLSGDASAELACAWEDIASRGKTPPSWALADRMMEEGYAGIIVPSYAPGAIAMDRNVVFWRWGAEPPHQLRLIDDEGRLPKNDLSWR